MVIAANERQENIVVSEGTNDRDFTVGTSSNNMAINESTVKLKTLEKFFNETIDKKMSNIVDRIEVRIQNARLTAIDNIVDPKIELPIRSINASRGRDVTSVNANSERGEHVGIDAFFENASGNNNIPHASNLNDETRHKIPDEVSELSVPETRFDQQAHTRKNVISRFWKITYYCSVSVRHIFDQSLTQKTETWINFGCPDFICQTKTSFFFKYGPPNQVNST